MSDPPLSGPPPGPTSIALGLVVLGRLTRERLDAALTADGLSVRHVGTLGHLAHTPGLSYSELARRAGVTAQSMHSTVHTLEERGAVRRRSPTSPREAADLEITDAGRELLDRIHAVAAELDETLLAGCTLAQRAELAGLLGRVAANLWRSRG